MSLVTILSSPAAYAASFRCDGSLTPSEVAICGHPELSRLDENLTDLYDTVGTIYSDDPAEFDALINEQRKWLIERQRCGAEIDCLKIAYQNRISTLSLSLADPADEQISESDGQRLPSIRRGVNSDSRSVASSADNSEESLDSPSNKMGPAAESEENFDNSLEIDRNSQNKIISSSPIINTSDKNIIYILIGIIVAILIAGYALPKSRPFVQLILKSIHMVIMILFKIIRTLYLINTKQIFNRPSSGSSRLSRSPRENKDVVGPIIMAITQHDKACVYGVNQRLLFSMRGEVLNFTSETVTIKYDRHISLYDYKGNLITGMRG